MSKRFRNIFCREGLVALGLMLGSASAWAAGDLVVANYSPSTSSFSGYPVDLLEGGTKTPYLPPPQTNAFEIYFQDPSSSLLYSAVGVALASPTNVPMQLRYHGIIPNGTDNALYLQWFGTFPSNILVTAKVVVGGFSDAINVRTFIPSGGGGNAWTLPMITGALDGQVYGTATVYFAQLTPAQITSFKSNSGATLTLNAKVQLGTFNTVYCITNSLADGWSSASSVGNFYAGPAVGTVDSGWTNISFTVPLTGDKAFYRIASDPFNWP